MCSQGAMDGWVLTKRESVLAKAVNTMPVPHQKGDDMKRKKRAAKRTQRKTQLGVQKLETRKLMAGDVAMIDNVVSLTGTELNDCLLYTSPSPRDLSTSRMPSSA